jgi:hypothetical protein
MADGLADAIFQCKRDTNANSVKTNCSRRGRRTRPAKRLRRFRAPRFQIGLAFLRQVYLTFLQKPHAKTTKRGQNCRGAPAKQDEFNSDGDISRDAAALALDMRFDDSGEDTRSVGNGVMFEYESRKHEKDENTKPDRPDAGQLVAYFFSFVFSSFSCFRDGISA